MSQSFHVRDMEAESRERVSGWLFTALLSGEDGSVPKVTSDFTAIILEFSHRRCRTILL